jgi:hypothetical protein
VIDQTARGLIYHRQRSVLAHSSNWGSVAVTVRREMETDRAAICLGLSGCRGASWSGLTTTVWVVHGGLAGKYAVGVLVAFFSRRIASSRRSGLIVAWCALTVIVSVVCALGGAVAADAAWQTPVSISSRGSIGPVSLAVNARGDAIAAWGTWCGAGGFLGSARELHDRGGVQAGTRCVAASGQGGHRPPMVWSWKRRNSAGFRRG